MDFRIPKNLGKQDGPNFFEKRRKGRLRCELLVCELGQVSNISGSGLRVICDKKPNYKDGDNIKLTLRTQDQRLEVKARVEWVKPAEDGGYEVGAEFVEVTPQQTAELVKLARSGMGRVS